MDAVSAGRKGRRPNVEDAFDEEDDPRRGDAGITHPLSDEGERVWGDITAPPSQGSTYRPRRGPSPLRMRMSQLFSGLPPEILRHNSRA